MLWTSLRESPPPAVLYPFVPLQVVAVGARALSRAQEFAKRFNIPTVYGSYQELADDDTIGRYLMVCFHLT